MRTNRHYILDDKHNIIPEPDLLTWAKWYETADRHVAATVLGEYRISTVFLGTDHNFGFDPDNGNPQGAILFETMVFEPNRDWPELGLDFVQVADFDLWRYATWAEAEAGHAKMCELVRAAMQERARGAPDLGALLRDVRGI